MILKTTSINKDDEKQPYIPPLLEVDLMKTASGKDFGPVETTSNLYGPS